MNMCSFCSTHLPVTGVFRAGVVHTDDNKDVLEVRADILRGERQRSGLLEDYGDNVVPYVPLSQELRRSRAEITTTNEQNEQTQLASTQPRKEKV